MNAVLRSELIIYLRSSRQIASFTRRDEESASQWKRMMRLKVHK